MSLLAFRASVLVRPSVAYDHPITDSFNRMVVVEQREG